MWCQINAKQGCRIADAVVLMTLLGAVLRENPGTGNVEGFLHGEIFRKRK